MNIEYGDFRWGGFIDFKDEFFNIGCWTSLSDVFI